jgi:hypothetical protein
MACEVVLADVRLSLHDAPGRDAVRGSALEDTAEELARDDFSVARVEGCWKWG